MKHISHLVTEKQKTDSISTSTTQTGISRQTELPKEAKAYFNELFGRLVLICPAWKNAAIVDVQAWTKGYKSELAAELKSAGVKTNEQIEGGIEKIRHEGSPFLPAPGQFAKACLGDEGGDLSHNTAAYKNRDFDTYGQRQICHKRSEEEAKAGLNRISALRASAKLPKIEKEPKSDEKTAIDPGILKQSRQEMVDRVKAFKKERDR